MTNINTQIGKQTTRSRQNSVGWMLNMLTRTVDDIMKTQLEPLGLTQVQFAILMILMEEDGISQATIGKRIILPSYAMTRNLDTLEERQLIERQPDASSRRSFRIVLRDEGRALAPTLFEIVMKVNGEFLTDLEEDEVTQLKGLLAKLITSNLGK